MEGEVLTTKTKATSLANCGSLFDTAQFLQSKHALSVPKVVVSYLLFSCACSGLATMLQNNMTLYKYET